MLSAPHGTRHRRARPVLLSLSVLGLAVGLAACGTTAPKAGSSAPSSSAGGTTIVIKNFAFSPATLSVAPGSTVIVKNLDSVTHTLTSTTGTFNTGDVTSGHSVTFTAPSTPGTYPYQCDIHQFMTGTLVVRAG